MRNFVLVFNRRTGKILERSEFAEDERQRALDKRFYLELRHSNDPDLEVVSLSAESLAALENTHSRYFGDSLRRRAASLPG